MDADFEARVQKHVADGESEPTARKLAKMEQEVAEAKKRAEDAEQQLLLAQTQNTNLRYEIFLKQRAKLMKCTRPCRYTEYWFTPPPPT